MSKNLRETCMSFVKMKHLSKGLCHSAMFTMTTENNLTCLIATSANDVHDQIEIYFAPENIK